MNIKTGLDRIAKTFRGLGIAGGLFYFIGAGILLYTNVLYPKEDFENAVFKGIAWIGMSFLIAWIIDGFNKTDD